MEQRRERPGRWRRRMAIWWRSKDLELQFRAALEPASEPGEERRDKCKHAGDTTARHDKSLDFSPLSEFLECTGSQNARGIGKKRCRQNGSQKRTIGRTSA